MYKSPGIATWTKPADSSKWDCGLGLRKKANPSKWGLWTWTGKGLNQPASIIGWRRWGGGIPNNWGTAD